MIITYKNSKSGTFLKQQYNLNRMTKRPLDDLKEAEWSLFFGVSSDLLYQGGFRWLTNFKKIAGDPKISVKMALTKKITKIVLCQAKMS